MTYDSQRQVANVLFNILFASVLIDISLYVRGVRCAKSCKKYFSIPASSMESVWLVGFYVFYVLVLLQKKKKNYHTLVTIYCIRFKLKVSRNI